MNYTEAIEYLEGAAAFGIKPGLERIEAILKELGHPEKAYKTIHVTGTNGKGSVVAMMQSVLENTGMTIGTFTSPHLISYTERIHCGGKDIREEDFAQAATVVREAAEVVVQSGVEAPTEFELLTAMAFWYFREAKADYVILEVGMGGLFDSTNVITPVVSVITNVAMDHMAYLGNTLEEVAHQKAGIMKKDVPVVTAAQHVPLKTLKKEAHSKGSRLYFYGRDFEIDSRSKYGTGQVVTVKRKGFPKELENCLLFVPFTGLHQAVNAAVAAMAISLVIKADERVNENDLREGLARARWMGRFDVRQVQGKTVIFDGAHNPAAAEALKETLEEEYPDNRRLLVFTSLQDKETATVMELLIRKGDKTFFVEAPTPRTRTTAELADLLQAAYKEAEWEEKTSVKEALNEALSQATEGGIIIVAGSLYILGEAMEWAAQKQGN